MLILFVGSLLGPLFGALLSIRFIGHEVADDVGPRFRRIRQQLDILEAEISLALGTRHAELNAHLTQDPSR